MEGEVEGERLLRLPAMKEKIGVGATSTIYAWISEGRFPKPVRLSGSPGQGGGAVAWRESELEAWIAERIASRDAGDRIGYTQHAKPRHSAPPKASSAQSNTGKAAR
jgi:prophage regulatory protein